MSKKKEGKWVWQAGATPPPLDAHSRIKHLVIKDYLSRYIQVLMANPLRPRLPLTLVDGFAGGGIYRNEEGGDAPGSPLLLLQTVSSSESDLNSGRHTTQRQIDATYHFVEPSTPNFHCLNHTLREAGYGAAIGNRVHLHQAEFEAVADHIIGSIAARPGERALFLLDQYNYSDVDLRLVRRILTSLRGSEVILTFNVGSLISFLSDTPRARKTAARIGLEQFIHWPSISMLKASGRYREGIQRQLAHGIHQASGAQFMTLFFVTPQGSSPWSYWLVHLSNAYKANDVMKEVHWLHGNSFGHSLEPGLFRLGYQANRDSLVTGQSPLAFDTPVAFDSFLHTSSVNNLREHLCRTLFESTSGCSFDDMVLNLANNTNATAEMIKESLNEPVLSGEIMVITEGGGRRRKGGSIAPGDLLQFKQSPLLFT